MEMRGNFGWWEDEIQNFCFSAQASEQPQAMECPNQPIGQEVGEPLNTATQPLISELVKAVHSQCAQQFSAFIPKVVEAVRMQCAQEFQALIPIMVEAVHTQCAQEFRDSIPRMVEEMKKIVHSPGLRTLPNQPVSSAPRSLRLHFVNSWPDTLYTLTNVKDSKDPVMVELHDSFGSRVKVGPESSANVRLVALDGDFEVDDKIDWTREEFIKNVAKPRKDRGALLKGKPEIKLHEGVAIFTDIAFTDNSKSMRNGTFRLGAELANGVAREAVSGKAFKVKERRLIMTYGKCMSLKDNARNLKNIGDKMAQKLVTKKINTVMDFLQLYHTDAKALQEILHIPEKKLSDSVKSAELCRLNKEGYSYCNDTEGVDLVLDCVFNVVSVRFKGTTSQAYESLDDFQKELVDKLKGRAYEKREELPRICIVTNQISVQAEPLCPSSSSIQPIHMQFSDTTAENRDVNNPVQDPFRHQIPEFDVDHCDRLRSLLEEIDSSNLCITGKLKAQPCDREAGTPRGRWTLIQAVVRFKIAIKISDNQDCHRASKRPRTYSSNLIA